MENIPRFPTTPRSDQPCPRSSGVPHPAGVTDVILEAAFCRGADAIWLEPRPNSESYDLTLAAGSERIAKASLVGSVASACIARLAEICHLDLTAEGKGQTGRSMIQTGGQEFDLVLTTRVTGLGLRAEVLVIDRQRKTSAAKSRVSLPSRLPAQTMVGHYRVIELLGRGGMGAVYRAEHVALAKDFAIKVLHAELFADDPTNAQRFLREARATARIQHEGIVNVVDFGYVVDGRPYFVMELLSGRSLSTLIANHRVSAQRTLGFLRQLASGLRAAHDVGVIHRDLSPSNVFVEDTKAGELLKLVDFGVAELRGCRIDLEEDPDIVYGTPCYMAPEQIRGKTTDERTDVYALGVVAYEMLTGAPPFDGGTVGEVVQLHLTEAPRAPEAPDGPLPPDLVNFVLRCLEKEPAARFQNMELVLVELERIERAMSRRGWRRWIAS